MTPSTEGSAPAERDADREDVQSADTPTEVDATSGGFHTDDDKEAFRAKLAAWRAEGVPMHLPRSFRAAK